MPADDTPEGAKEAPGLFRVPSLADPAVGGKARSLARLAALGVPVPAAFVVVSSPDAPVLEGRGPAPPAALRTSRDLAALDQARAALLDAPFSAVFRQALPAALDALGAPDEHVTFAVRSSAALEDSARTAAPGVFDSVLRVPRSQVDEAVRAVLASALAPAAWAYVLRAGAQAPGPIAVLVHRFVAGDAHGAVVCEPVPGGAARVQLDVQDGALAPAARAVVEAAARKVGAQAGPVELEWTAAGETVTFLQLRPFQGHRATARAEGRAPRPAPAGWTWDAAHNPLPLTPAQAGLVDWVDARCTLPFRQRVIDGYLFYQAVPGPPAPSGTPRALFEALAADVSAGVATLGPKPRLSDALALYTRGYQGLFGVVQPACLAARAALTDFLQAHAPDAGATWQGLLAGVPTAATRRRDLVAAIAAAGDASARAAATGAYLHAFGDESPRWDVAEPTLRERPEALLFVGRAADVPGAPAAAEPSPPSSGEPAEVVARAATWPEDRRAQFQDRLEAARQARAVGEDDDALFARLQAVVRAALRVIGARLAGGGHLADADDIFFLPLEVVRALDEGAPVPLDLQGLAAAGRAAFAAAVSRPPNPPIAAADARTVRGQSGAGGRAIGRVMLHPAPVVPGPAGASVIVAATLLPTELPLLEAAALVVETGTPLGHVAAQARERGIPAVVAASGARAAFAPGQLVLVDGDRGLVIALDEP